MKNKTFGKKSVITALFAALICAGSFIQIPIPGGIPVTVQDMMAMLSGMLLGPVYGGLAVLIFLILGSLGLPVFTGKAGLGIILNGPTGGFLIGYFCGAVAAGLIIRIFVRETPVGTEDGEPEKNRARTLLNWIFIALAAITATVIMFALGIWGFHRIKPDFEMKRVLAAVLLPFIPGNTIKIIVAVPLVKKLCPAINNFMDRT